jgi:hypothetical protein
MAPIDHIKTLRICLAAMLSSAAALVGSAAASTRVEVFQAQAPLEGRSEAAQTAAFQAALRIVLVRATGRRTADEESVFAPLVGNARRYVQQFRTAPDNQVWVAFDGAAIERWLAQNGQPLWGHDRPSTLVWLTVPPGPAGSSIAGGSSGGPTGTVISADDASELKDSIDAAAVGRGIPLIWPDAAAAGSASATAAETAQRLGAEGVLIGRASSATSGANIRWSLLFQDHGSEFSGPLEGVNRAADLYAGLFAASGSLAPVDIEVSGVADLREYAGVQSYLESLSAINHVAVLGLTADTVKFRLSARGGAEPLAHAIGLSGKLQALPAGDNGIQRFQLRQ